ncbi:uncharacterized protein RHOBADRAFT_51111 [Rhodotorula graminis WP1]|uniref:Uncharacterized protein n=1 Tax=Rhodotorula graminis (strain WP1) TaxID=578459 RepID=A0A194SDK0_RHOGW|nr:uncharacterized protein RHOBADRAFT_51111 [Rhodotorula graminis WP1]KPV78672.1 hypothetical protein RHOBADRAFT_51111 [Rhodotorula graminis WP1]
MQRLVSPACPAAPHLSPSAPASSIGSPSPAALPPPLVPTEHPLFLSIDASSSEVVRACVLDERLRVVWTEEVSLDVDLASYGIRHGVYTLGDSVTCPSEARLHALDLVLEKLAREGPDPTLLGRVVAISGAGQPHTLHYLSPSFPSLLSALSHTPCARISSILTADRAFSLAHPPTSGDSSAAPQVRELELHCGDSAASISASMHEEEEGGSGRESVAQRRERGRVEMARRTGSRATARSAAAQLLRVVQMDQGIGQELERGQVLGGSGVLGGTDRVVLEGGLFASVFLGRYAPTDAADACSTNLFDPVGAKWDDDLLAFVGSGGSKMGEGAQAAGERLRALLGEVEVDGGVELGKISPFFVKRFGFSPNCIIVPFSGSDPSAFLSFPLSTSASPSHRDALLSLSSVADTDTLAVSIARFVPDPERSVVRHPAKAWWELGPVKGKGKGRERVEKVDEQDEEGTPDFVAFISSRDAGIGRALARDMYCNGQWPVFAHLSAIVPHGGTIGLDDKHFSFFFPHGEATSAQGLVRFAHGARVTEFVDRKINPRLLVESQVMSLRIRLAHLYRSLLADDDPSLASLRPHDPLGFPARSSAFSPSHLILVGEAAENPALSSLVSTIFHSPTFLPLAGGLKSCALGQVGLKGGEAHAEFEQDRQKTTAAALGSAYKAAWAHARAAHGVKVPFATFLSRAVEAQALEIDGGSASTTSAGAKVEQHHRSGGSSAAASRPSTASASASGSGSGSGAATSTSALSRLSLPRHGHSEGNGSRSGLEQRSSPAAFGAHALGSSRDGGGLEDQQEGAGGGRGPTGELAPDPPGLSLVAVPDQHEAKYYDSMLPEFVRLERAALKGLV